MFERAKKILENTRIRYAIKTLFCVMIVGWLYNCVYLKGFDAFFCYQDYYYQNDSEDYIMVGCANSLEQHFYSEGNVLSNISIYFGEVSDSELSIEIVGENNKTQFSKKINVSSYQANTWNRISIDCNDLVRGRNYCLSLKGDDLSYLTLSKENVNRGIIKDCYVDGVEVPYVLASGLQITYKYLTVGYGLELFVFLFFVAVLGTALCYTVFNIEKIYACFVSTEKKKGFLYALYFAVSTVLLFNPIEAIRTEATEFGRVMGDGFNAGVDVAKRISNFNHWFICLATVFVLYFLLANFLKNKKLSKENKKVALLLDNVIVIANLILGLRCIAYFYNDGQGNAAFYYSDFIIMAVILIALAYLLLGLEKKISVNTFEALLLSGWMLALPVSIMIAREWNLGRGFMGLQILAAILLVMIVRFVKIDWNKTCIVCSAHTTIVFLSLIPFCTSLYIELLVWLNRREIFLTAIRRYYFSAILLGILITSIIAFISIKKEKCVTNWKSIAYPLIVLGFSCLWCQIPISATYSVNIFETANSSVLISDFLNFGDIPIVQHYGGHMMSGVWEGLLYAILNKDYFGATFSPYAGYISVVIAVLFFFFVKKVWDEDAAIVVALFFPFSDTISYWGLGLLTVLAAAAYVRKNTYPRAILFWLACIWCAIYRLDLGFAFLVASVLSLMVYIIVERNTLAVKQLAITLMGWGVIGLEIWFGICIAKDLNPIDRLLEFLYINLSNQNWAYAWIGDPSQTKFAFIYLFLPVLSVIAMIFTFFSRKTRENLGIENWVVLLILGLSYFCNYSRGLVRHSLVENTLINLWSVFVFLAAFIAAYQNNKRLFLPVFAGFMLCSTLCQSGNIFVEGSIADNAVGRLGTYTETWTVGRFSEEDKPRSYWTQLCDDKEVIERVKWDKDEGQQDLKKLVDNYQILLDSLIDADETFVDLVNRTSIYPLLGRRNPVYVSQSPLQLSGEFTQEQFIKQINGVPIVLMPYDNESAVGYGALDGSLDGVPDLYRYYKVMEYIYQNYVPLCTFENQGVVWCLSERYHEMAAKVNDLMQSGTDVTSLIRIADTLECESAEIVNHADGSFTVQCTGADPQISELQNAIDITPYIGREITISIGYETDVLGEMQIYYTTDSGEEYDEGKVSAVTLRENKGTAYFKIPVTEHTRIRLDTPEGSNVKIVTFRTGVFNCQLIDYGYDGPFLQENGVDYVYYPYIHNYGLSKLPVIWAEGDTKNSSENRVIADLNYDNGFYRYDLHSDSYGAEGNYLKVNLTYDGWDWGGQVDSDDETIDATITVGRIRNGNFEPKYLYTFTVKEGQHAYIFRISNDYYWYTGQTNAIKLECGGELLNVNMQILEGD